MIKHWHMAQEAVGSPFLDIFRTWLKQGPEHPKLSPCLEQECGPETCPSSSAHPRLFRKPLHSSPAKLWQKRTSHRTELITWDLQNRFWGYSEDDIGCQHGFFNRKPQHLTPLCKVCCKVEKRRYSWVPSAECNWIPKERGVRTPLNTSTFAAVTGFPTNAVTLQDTDTNHIENRRPATLTTEIFSISAELCLGNTPWFCPGRMTAAVTPIRHLFSKTVYWEQ